MIKKIAILALAGALSAPYSISASSIGEWKTYMSYYEIQDVEKVGNLIYVQASDNLYIYNTNDQSIQTFDKINGLNDCDIDFISYNSSAKKLIIIYSDYNIDFLDANGNITNLSDYYNATITGGKEIYDIYNYGKYAYISTKFGIMKINVANAEISETYNLGFAVNWTNISDGSINAYSSTQGHYEAFLTNNLLDKNNWYKCGDYVAKTNENKDETKAIVSSLNIDGPKYNYFWNMKFIDGKLYTCGGGFGHGIETNRPGTIQVLDNDKWTIYQDEGITSVTGLQYVDINDIDVDPNKEGHLFAGGRNGLYEFQDGKFVKHYNSDNSLISPFMDYKEYEIIGSVHFNDDGNLWLLNNQSSKNQSLIEYTSSGQWISHHKSQLIEESTGNSLGSMEKMITDSRGLLWFVNKHWQTPSLYAYQPSTDQINCYTSFINQDGTVVSTGSITSVAEDLDNNIWIGTTGGPLLLKADDISDTSPIFQQVKVPRNDGTNLADYLLDGVAISSIAIDGAGRKWFGTEENGVYLISEDNYTQEQHFTKENSFLLSNIIESIAINPTTGEVFFGTDKGLCSYMSNATTANSTMNKDNVWAYPNPVKPDYTGIITVTGLTMDADIKIVTSNGTLVNEGRSNGGIYTWDGTDLNGNKVASGVYMVETATSTGNKGTVCKIAIIR